MTPQRLNFDGELASAPNLSMRVNKQSADEEVTIILPCLFLKREARFFEQECRQSRSFEIRNSNQIHN